MVTQEPYRVMVVDDSAVIRGLLSRALESDPTISVVASVGNGEHALRTIERQDIDVIVLDIEMPVMDGMTALPLLLKARPGVRIIMASTLTRKNAEISLRALQAGAMECIAKPSSGIELHGSDGFKRQLIDKVKALGEARRGRPARSRPQVSGARPSARHVAPVVRQDAPIILRPGPLKAPDIIAIGSSTGGPQALVEVIGHLSGNVTQPILITQHMPPTFTALLAEHLDRTSSRSCAEAKEGEPVVGHRIYVAPGDQHMLVERRGAREIIRLSTAPPEHFCRPAVDPMLRSLSALHGSRLLIVILTGMGSDGRRGSEAAVAKGATVIGQDEASSVVWGMPGAVAGAGLCSSVLPLCQIAPHISKLAMRSAA